MKRTLREISVPAEVEGHSRTVSVLLICVAKNAARTRFRVRAGNRGDLLNRLGHYARSRARSHRSTCKP